MTPEDVAATLLQNFIVTAGDTLTETIRKGGAPNAATLEVASRGADLAKIELLRAVQRIRCRAWTGDAVRVHVDRRMLKDHQAQEDARCAECGYVSEHATVMLGDADRAEWGVDGLTVCVPCLKRAVAEAEAAVAKDKG